MKTAIYPGSFDPITLGHLNIIKRAALCFDKLIVCVMVNSQKNGLFTPEERVKLIRRGVSQLPNVEVDASSVLLADTMFLPSNEKYTYLSSTVVKEMVRYGVDLSDFIPREIIADVKQKMNDSRRDG